MKQPNEMTDPELNEATAIEVMRWQKDGSDWWKSHSIGHHQIMSSLNNWHPTTDLNQAIECLHEYAQIGEELDGYWSTHPHLWSISNGDSDSLDVCIGGKSFVQVGQKELDKLPRAICEAVLMAKRGEK